ncbi:hypothetical protein [Dyadobacter sp. NIV53]|uniref:hypothetical protein n=1 Tax=Dyadobacter sp. NIV53 TaxID=2861765 RepID=UPI001C871D21|nr:hypothetical protein [Dyadobacter sp. NIV53]
MLKKLRFLLFAPLWLACQPGDPATEFSSEPDLIAYNDDAPLLKKTYCYDGNCTEISGEENYIYNAAGKLTKMELKSRTVSGKLELQSYTDHLYNNNGVLIRKIMYSKNSPASDWLPGNESEYEYINGVVSLEKTYLYVYNSGQKVLTGQIKYEFKNGKKLGQSWTDGQNNLLYRVEYAYKNDVLSLETWYDGKDKVNRIFEHKFAGNRRQIGEYLINTKEQLALIEKTYDEKGRLSTQITKVSNPLLCSLAPGLIRYSY